MANSKSLWVSPSRFKMGQAKLGWHGAGFGSVKQNVHDGDTVNVSFFKNLGVRFLGMDTPEISFQLPGDDAFVALSQPAWTQFFASGEWREKLNVGAELMTHLEQRIGDGSQVAANHAYYAEAAQRTLETLMQRHLDLSGKPKEEFTFFMAFAHEFLDVYGRLLCYLHAGEENFGNKTDREEAKKWSYNEQQLANGAALPYFIWPNVQPFLSVNAFAEDSVRPDRFWKKVNTSKRLQEGRRLVSQARAAGLGVHSPQNPLILRAFELRFISRKKGPDRFVINLADPGNHRLMAPELYFQVPHDEDRLYVPKEYAPIFQMYGWTVG